MANKNQLGLSDDYVSSAVEKLNGLLADVQVSYMNVRGFHWNIQGEKFFMLHEKFEELYDELADNADEIAERILMLGGRPVHAFSEYLKKAQLKEVMNVNNAKGTVNTILETLKHLLVKEKEIIVEAADAGDEGTVDLLTGYVSAQEKQIWMYSSFLS
jgi:starvation-inducible DNA-binding protein